MDLLERCIDWFAAQPIGTQRFASVLLIAAITAGLLRVLKAVLNHMEKKGLDSSAKPLLYSLFSYALYIAALLAMLNAIGVNTAGIVTMVGAASLAVGLAVKDLLSNIAAGLLLLFLKPFKADDYIECGGVKGRIEGVGLFNTTLKTVDGLYVSAPNSRLWGDPIVNYSRNGLRRLEIETGIDYASSVDKAVAILQEMVAAEPLFLSDPAPQFFVSSLGESAVNVAFRAWIRTDAYWNARWKYTALVKERFQAAGIGIPFPQRTVHFAPGRPEGNPADPAVYARKAPGGTSSEEGQANFG